MSEQFPIVSVDYGFAQSLDTACNSCLSGGSNNFLFKLLEHRKKTHPSEKQVTELLQNQCRNCADLGKPYMETITARFSCLYRAGLG